MVVTVTDRTPKPKKPIGLRESGQYFLSGRKRGVYELFVADARIIARVKNVNGTRLQPTSPSIFQA